MLKVQVGSQHKIQGVDILHFTAFIIKGQTLQKKTQLNQAGKDLPRDVSLQVGGQKHEPQKF